MINVLDEGLKIEKELTLYHKGYHICDKGYGFGPFVRDHYLMHFVVRGKGRFTNEYGSFNLGANEAFLIYPDSTTYYQADEREPWTYYWIGFHGEKVESILEMCNLSRQMPILRIVNNKAILPMVESIYNLNNILGNFDLKSRGLLYLLFDEIKNQNMNQPTVMRPSNIEDYIEHTYLYIKRNYTKDIKVKDIADYLNLDRSYFSRIFKEFTMMSPQEYLIRFRIEKAKILLKSLDLSISSVAYSVGYKDQYYFSRIFKKYVGVSPRIFKF